LAIDALKARIPELEEYQTWYDKVHRVFDDKQKYSDDDLDNILNQIDDE